MVSVPEDKLDPVLGLVGPLGPGFGSRLVETETLLYCKTAGDYPIFLQNVNTYL